MHLAEPVDSRGDFQTLRKETFSCPMPAFLMVFAQSWKPGMKNMNFLFRVEFSGCTTSYEAMKCMVGNCCTCSCISDSLRLHTESKSTDLILSHFPLPNHDSKADKSAQERGAQYMDWDKSATPDAKDRGTDRQWPSTWVGNLLLLHNVRCTLEPQNVCSVYVFLFQGDIFRFEGLA